MISLFGRRAAIYANRSSDHKPVGLFICSACGGLATEDNKEIHTQWHEWLSDQLKEKAIDPKWNPNVKANYWVSGGNGQFTKDWNPTIFNTPSSNITYSSQSFTIDSSSKNDDDDGCNCE